MDQDISLLNTAIGPVMRGPSSSHSAAPYMIGRTIRELSLGPDEQLMGVNIYFDPAGSFAQVYQNQGSDQGFAAGLCGLALMSPEYAEVLKQLETTGLPRFEISLQTLELNEHPNRVDLKVEIADAKGNIRCDTYAAVSTGGGVFSVDKLNQHRLRLKGKCVSILIEHHGLEDAELLASLANKAKVIDIYHEENLVQIDLESALPPPVFDKIQSSPFVDRVRQTQPRQYASINEEVLYSSLDKILHDVKDEAHLADLALSYEARRLQQSHSQVRNYFIQRLDIMLSSVDEGLNKQTKSMRFLPASAQSFAQAKLPSAMQSGFMKNAIAGALAVMEVSSSRGVVCAAPTAGSAGIVPGCLYALKQEGASQDELVQVLMVISLVGALFAARGSFAAETGGCSVETGASAAMAAAGIVHYYQGSAQQAFDAAAMCLMNTLGLVCDPVGGEVEIPCHARNIAGVSHAWSASIAILGGFSAVIPFDELVDKTQAIGKQMSSDLRCTAKGGCATTPCAQQMVSKTPN